MSLSPHTPLSEKTQGSEDLVFSLPSLSVPPSKVNDQKEPGCGFGEGQQRASKKPKSKQYAKNLKGGASWLS
jgi:hypothetical protein